MAKVRIDQEVYTRAARTVLQEGDGEPTKVGMLFKEVSQRFPELAPEQAGKWAYHNFLRALKMSPEFNTSRRGYAGLSDNVPANAAVGVA